ncbi:MAG: MgtC/SapB family protein [Gammaproteobacteria bacterium]|nr:MgtC/SapB family protein [Gammaproteobacteria bacterium]
MAEVDVIVVRNFLIALLIGALVGIEREKTKTAAGEITFGGLRTFILFAQAGAVGAWLSLHYNTPWIFVASLVAVSAAVITGYVLESRINPDSVGLTTEIAAITVCLLGGAVMSGYPELAVALAILTSSVLTFKQPLHGIVAKLGTDDIYAGLKLLIATFIVLPLLPTTPIDPWQALNPYKLWLLVILISALSLIGYVAVRWLGSAHGAAITGIAGGLASSTAVSLSFARQSRTDSSASAADAFAAGILLAWAVMFARVVLTIAIVYRGLVAHVLIPFGTMALAAATVGIFFYRRRLVAHRSTEPTMEVPMKNPFSLTAASQFGLLFAVVLLVVKLTQQYAPAEGLYIVSAVAGLTDVDAITLSMSEFARQGGQLATAATAVTVAAVSNTVVKCGFVAVLGSASMRQRVVPTTVAILILGLASLFFV